MFHTPMRPSATDDDDFPVSTAAFNQPSTPNVSRDYFQTLNSPFFPLRHCGRKSVTSQTTPKPADFALSELLANLRCLDSFDLSSPVSSSSLDCLSGSTFATQREAHSTPYANKCVAGSASQAQRHSVACFASNASCNALELDNIASPWSLQTTPLCIKPSAVSAEEFPVSQPSIPALPPMSSSSATLTSPFDDLLSPLQHPKKGFLFDLDLSVESLPSTFFGSPSNANAKLPASGLIAQTLEAWDQLDYYSSHSSPEMLLNSLWSKVEGPPSTPKSQPSASTALPSRLLFPSDAPLVSCSEEHIMPLEHSLQSICNDSTVYATPTATLPTVSPTTPNTGKAENISHGQNNKSPTFLSSDHSTFATDAYQQHCVAQEVFGTPTNAQTYTHCADRAPSFLHTAASASLRLLPSVELKRQSAMKCPNSFSLEDLRVTLDTSITPHDASPPVSPDTSSTAWTPLQETLAAPEALQQASVIFQTAEARHPQFSNRSAKSGTAAEKSKTHLKTAEKTLDCAMQNINKDSVSNNPPEAQPADEAGPESNEPTLTRTSSVSGIHPTTCKPCAFFWTRGCLNGDACQFCHEKHTPKKKKPMKDQKNLMIIARPDGKMEYLRCTVEEALRRS